MTTERKTKTLYRYYCKMRPPAPGAIPKRNLYAVLAAHIHTAGNDRHMWGLVDYTEPLTDEEIDYYELVPGGTWEKGGMILESQRVPVTAEKAGQAD